MESGKRWPQIIVWGVLTGAAAWLSALAAGGASSWSEAWQLQYVLPGLIAMVGAWVGFYQPSTYEGMRSAREE